MPFTDGDSEDLLHLHVHGQVFQVRRKVMTQVPDSLLAAKFSGRWDNAGSSRSLSSHSNVLLPAHHENSIATFRLDVRLEIFQPFLENLIKRFEALSGDSLPSPGSSSESKNEDIRIKILNVNHFGKDKTLFRQYLGLVHYYGLLDSFYKIWIRPSIVVTNTDFSPLMGDSMVFSADQALRFGKPFWRTRFDLVADVRDFLYVETFQIDVDRKVDGSVVPIQNIKIGLTYASNGQTSFRGFDHCWGAATGSHDLSGKRWVVQYNQTTIQLVITRWDGTCDFLELDLQEDDAKSIPTASFDGTGAFLISSVKLSFRHESMDYL